MPNVTFWTDKKLRSKPWLYPRQLRSKLESKDPVAGLKHHGSEGRACVVLQLAFVLHGSGQGTPSQGSNTMAVKDGAGPRPVAQSAKRYFLNRETEVQTVTSKDPVAGLKHATAAVQAGVQGPCRRAKTPWQWRTGLRCLAAGFCAARLRSRDPLAGLKHHGSEGRSGPAARSPECQTLLSEPTRNWGPNRDFQATLLAGLKHHGSEGRIGPAGPCRRAKTPECQTLLSDSLETAGPRLRSPRTLSQG